MFESESVSHSVMSDSWRFHVAMKFSRQEYWGGLPFPSLGDLPDPGIEPRYPALWADSLPAEPPGKRTNLATGVGSLFLLQGIFPTRDRTQVSLIAGGFFTS